MNQLSELIDGYNHPWLQLSLVGAVALAGALLAHLVLFKALRRVTGFSVIARSIVEFTRIPARLVLPLLALQFVMAAAPPDLPFEVLAARTLSILLIAAVTWLGMRAIAGVGDAMIRLHPVDLGDNLHARRIQTQTRVLARTAMFFLLLIGAASALMTFPGMRQIGASLLASAGVRPPCIGQPYRRIADRVDPAHPPRRCRHHRRRMGAHRGNHFGVRGGEDLGRAPARSAPAMGDRASIPELDSYRGADARHGFPMGRLSCAQIPRFRRQVTRARPNRSGTK
jgi:hypothetical protein